MFNSRRGEERQRGKKQICLLCVFSFSFLCICLIVSVSVVTGAVNKKKTKKKITTTTTNQKSTELNSVSKGGKMPNG